MSRRRGGGGEKVKDKGVKCSYGYIRHVYAKKMIFLSRIIEIIWRRKNSYFDVMLKLCILAVSAVCAFSLPIKT